MAAAGGICPPECEALLDDLCERFPFAAESHVLCMLTAAQGDAEVVAECLSEYPAARLCQPWILPGEYDACGLWRPMSQVSEPPFRLEMIGLKPATCESAVAPFVRFCSKRTHSRVREHILHSSS